MTYYFQTTVRQLSGKEVYVELYHDTELDAFKILQPFQARNPMLVRVESDDLSRLCKLMAEYYGSDTTVFYCEQFDTMNLKVFTNHKGYEIFEAGQFIFNRGES